MRVEKKTKLLPIEFIGTSHNSVHFPLSKKLLLPVNTCPQNSTIEVTLRNYNKVWPQLRRRRPQPERAGGAQV